MNKLNVLAILLLVAAGSQLLMANTNAVEEAKASDKEEVAALDEKSDALSGFCLEIRDYVTSSMQSQAESAKMAVANIFESSKEQLRKYAGQASERAKKLANEDHLKKVDELMSKGQKSLGERLSGAPLSPSSLLGGAKKVLNKASNFVVEQQRAIGKRLQETPVEPSAVFNSARAALSQASGAFKKGITSAREATTRMMGDTCKLMADYEKEIERRFEALKASDESLSQMSLEDVECVTVAGINSMRKACREQKM